MRRGCKSCLYQRKSTPDREKGKCQDPDLGEWLTLTGQQGGLEVGENGEEKKVMRLERRLEGPMSLAKDLRFF